MDILQAQGWVALLLGVAALAAQAWSFVDALLNRPDAFVAAGKRTKGFWLAVTGGATLIGFVFVLNPFNIFSLVAIVAAGIYLTDVRPALRAVGGRGRRSGSAGPYGPW